MRPENYSTLKSASKVAFSKDGDVIKLTQKKFNANTGVAESDLVREVELSDYENEKSHLEGEKASIESKISGLEAIITDIKAL
jgi:hypothetical protein